MTPTEQTVDAAPAQPGDVVTALAAVMAELGGVGKMTAAERARRGVGGGDTGITYPYRGIDQIAGAAQPLFGRHQIVTVPVVEESRVTEIVVKDKPWTDTYVRVRWLICGPAGVDDRLEAVTEGLGRDNSDKGFNKAMTGAYKNLLLRLLCIGDPADDTDRHTAERDLPPAMSEENVGKFLTAAADAGLSGDEIGDVVHAATGGRTRIPGEVYVSEVAALRHALEAATARTPVTPGISS